MSLDVTAAPLGLVQEQLSRGEAVAAIAPLRTLMAKEPANAEVRYWLASALTAVGDHTQAAAALNDARILHAIAFVRSIGGDVARCQQDGAYAASVAQTLYAQHCVAAASVIYGMAISAGAVTAEILLGYGLALQHQGRGEEAIQVFRAAAETFPSAQIEQFMLYPHFLVQDGPARYAAEARRWAERHAPPASKARTFANPPSGHRKLRVGYVASTFAKSQIGQFITPVLENHDFDQVEVFLYPANAQTDGDWRPPLTVRPIGHLDDASAAAVIAEDRIDVLIDCWGHSAGSRLPMFAHRAAPVQAAWINFVQTTGLSEMDYVLHADSADAPGTAALFTEQIWRTGDIFIPFRPLPDRPGQAPAPAIRNGYATFGCFNHPAKLSDATLLAWGRILAARPAAKLVLKYRYFIDPVLQRATIARLAGYGATPSQVEFRGHSTGQEYLREFTEIDLALDPSPAPGGTTSCDAMSNGVPVLTLAGPDFYSRIGICAALGCGAPELVAESWDDYVDKALALTDDTGALDALRRKVRSGFENGPFRDEPGFTRRIEADFRAMFDRWRRGEPRVRGAA